MSTESLSHKMQEIKHRLTQWQEDPTYEEPGTWLVTKVVNRGHIRFYSGYNNHTGEEFLMESNQLPLAIQARLDFMPRGDIRDLNQHQMDKITKEGMDDDAEIRTILHLRKAA